MAPSQEDLAKFFALLQEEEHERKYNRLAYMYPDSGPLRRELYPKHMEIFAAGKEYRERGFMGGNGVGKSEGVGAYETALHATGLYPKWWPGKRFDGPIDAWACGTTLETTRDIVQAKLLGNFAKLGDDARGTGLIPRHLIKHIHSRDGVAKFAEIQHVSGGSSVVGFKSYEQGRTAFEGTEKHWIQADEEAPKDIYGEMVARGRTVDGAVLATFTPLQGLTPLVEDFVNANSLRETGRSIFTVFCDMDDVPHLCDKEKREMLAAFPVWQRKARKSGFPVVGEGLIYPVEEEFFVIPPFKIPAHFRRVYGFDGGWHNTAVVWLAYYVDEDTVYAYKDYKRGNVLIPVHASTIKAQGVWIPGVGDVFSTNQSNGEKVQKLYKAEGVRIAKADKSVDVGIQEVMNRLETGRLKVFSTCVHLLAEMRKYRYEKQETKFCAVSKIVKKDDHLMDALRYGIHSGLKLAKPYRGDDYRPMSSGEKTFGLH